MGMVAFPATKPFRIPVGARVTEETGDGRGWQAGGEVSAPFVQAKARLFSSITAAGWSFLHEIPLGGGRGGKKTLMAFSRGNSELTVMVWRLAVDRSGFSYGLSRRSRKGK